MVKLWSLQSLNPFAAKSINKLHAGIFYTEYLKQIHRVVKPFSYLEIGVHRGVTLSFATCPMVGIDPNFQMQDNSIGQRTKTYLFELESDAFFAQHDLRNYLPDGVDFAFLDGMHLFEFLLRDFMNTEKYAHKNTIVALHDCYPVNSEIAGRELNDDRRTDARTRGMWAGDVWKLLPILRELRPDLTVTALDCPPTGLVVIRGCDANSTTLAGTYDQIVAKYRDVSLDRYGIERFRTEFPTTNSRGVMQPDALKKFLSRSA